MNNTNNQQMIAQLGASHWLTPWLSAVSLIAGLLVAPTAFTASPDLATKPLAVSGGVVKPNLMFVMDTSKSMQSDLANDALGVRNDTNSYVANAGQCKSGAKASAVSYGGITAATRGATAKFPSNPDTRLTIWPGNGRSVGNRLYITFPGNPAFSGIYTVKKVNVTAATYAPVVYGTCKGWNTSVINNVNPVTCQGATGGSAGNPSADPPIPPTPSCSCVGAQPANQATNFSTNVTYTGTGTTASCRWYDPKDTQSAIGTVCVLGYNDNTGGQELTAASDDGFEIDVANAGTSGAFSADQVKDAQLTWANQDTNSCLLGEPPLSAAKVQTLFYDPTVNYEPPPSPAKIAAGSIYPNNLLPAMTSAYTSAWARVPKDGTKLNAMGVPTAPSSLPAADRASLLALADVVWCDTRQQPSRKDPLNSASGSFSNAREWLESNRCRKNSLTANTVVKAPNYPYVYPAKTDGGLATPSKTSFITTTTVDFQVGQSKTGKNPVYDTFNSPTSPTPGGSDNPNAFYVFAQTYNNSAPYYYNINPIEYCTNATLSNCQLGSTPSGVYTVPSYVRYCKTDVQATDTSSTQGANCQGLYTGTGASDFRYPRYGLFERVDIVNNGKTFPMQSGLEVDKATTRKDCVGTRCTYAEEMTNYANWYAYYRSRIQLMKSASGRTFDSLNADNDADSDYRVGFITVEDYNTAGKYLPIDDFKGSSTTAQKTKWFNTLYSQVPSGGTALRDVLSTVGRIYAGKHPVTNFNSDDPVQYSCQQNFTLLTTDGYWNGAAGKVVDGSASVGNQDAAPTPLPYREGAAAVDTLADVAKYYYDTDIRDISFGNCTGALGSDVCLNDVKAFGGDEKKSQHMTTFTLGLGVDGLLYYSPTYQTDTTGDYADIKSGAKTWPVPGPDDGNTTFTAFERATVDDLWHAAVNGRGTYFSAKNPDTLIAGISGTLLALGDAPGSGSAIALSTSTPSPTDHYAYSARFTTGVWSGNLFARTFDKDGNLSANALWCVENESSVSPPCTGVLASQRLATSDTRNIYFNNASVLTSFSHANLPASKKTYFNSAYLSTRLNQWKDGEYSAAQIANAGGDSLVNYIRGQFGFEMRGTNALDNRLYRERAAVLGDIVDSDPIYVGKPSYQYTDAGYSTFVADNTLRPKTIYVGANDGMLHAFNADPLVDGGKERWAFIPTAVMPNLWKLADKNYRNIHTNYVNAEMSVNDVVIGGTWKTILVSGLGQGGRGYFALDITDPEAPALLWEFDSSTESNLGYSYGKPVITKRADGTWVVVLTSGYNNTSPGDGQGHLFVLDAATGAVLSDIATGVGSALTPSGLAQVSGYAKNPAKNNTSDYIYGGDLLGNLWRFDINAGTKTKIANLVDGSGNAQAVTVAPTLGEINSKRVVYVGTGKFIEPDDLLAVNYKQESFYAIQDDNLTAAIADLRSELVEQTLSADGSDSRTSSNNEVDWSVKLGWFVDFDTGERQNIKANLVSGVLFVPTLIPPTGLCDTNGRGWLNTFNYKTGGSPDKNVSDVVSTFITSPIAGLGMITPPPAADGSISSPRTIVTTTDAKDLNPDPPPPVTLEQFRGKRAIWRELIPE